MTTYKMFGNPNQKGRRDKNAKPVFDFVSGPDNQLCCNCDHVILANVYPDQILDIAIECPSCGSVNIPVKSDELPYEIRIEHFPLAETFGPSLGQEHLAAIGLLTLGWNALEYDYQQLIWAVANWHHTVGELTTLHMGNVSQVNLLKNLARRLIKEEKVVAEIDLISNFFDLLRQSRNDVIHAAFTRSTVSDEEFEFYKRDAKKPTGSTKLVTVLADKEHCLDLSRDISLARICAISLAKTITHAYVKDAPPSPLAEQSETSPYISDLKNRQDSLARLRRASPEQRTQP